MSSYYIPVKDYHLTYNGFNDIVQTFFATFARFFPTVTSINAGLKYSPEDLKVILYY